MALIIFGLCGTWNLASVELSGDVVFAIYFGIAYLKLFDSNQLEFFLGQAMFMCKDHIHNWTF
jgi:hypothetical protein